MQLFISHSTSDVSWVEPVCQLITDHGLSAYLAEHDVRPGELLIEKVKAAIDASAAVVVILTESSASSQIVRDEIAFALGRGKLVVPLVAPAVSTDPVSLGMLNGLEYVIFDLANPQPGLLQLNAWISRFAAEQQMVAERAQRVVLQSEISELRSTVEDQAQSLTDLKAQQDATLALLVLVGALAAVALVAAASSN